MLSKSPIEIATRKTIGARRTAGASVVISSLSGCRFDLLDPTLRVARAFDRRQSVKRRVAPARQPVRDSSPEIVVFCRAIRADRTA